MTEPLPDRAQEATAPDDHFSGTEGKIRAVIDAAEEVSDPLDGIVERVASEPGAALTPEAIEALTARERENASARLWLARKTLEDKRREYRRLRHPSPRTRKAPLNPCQLPDYDAQRRKRLWIETCAQSDDPLCGL